MQYAERKRQLEKEGFTLVEYGLVEYNNFNGPQYAVYEKDGKTVTLYYRYKKVPGTKDTWKADEVYKEEED